MLKMARCPLHAFTGILGLLLHALVCSCTPDSYLLHLIWLIIKEGDPPIIFSPSSPSIQHRSVCPKECRRPINSNSNNFSVQTFVQSSSSSQIPIDLVRLGFQTLLKYSIVKRPKVLHMIWMKKKHKVWAVWAFLGFFCNSSGISGLCSLLQYVGRVLDQRMIWQQGFTTWMDHFCNNLYAIGPRDGCSSHSGMELICKGIIWLSAKTNLNMEQVFFSIATDIKQRLSETDSKDESSTIKINQPEGGGASGQSAHKSSTCCG
ncbi:hypothetical protein LXL04_029199 [Taraxacum kok-saghyz]